MAVTIRMIACAVALAATASLGPAQAQQSQARTWCNDSEVDGVSLDLRISGCTTVIQSGEVSNSDLALAFNNRGFAYSAKGQHDRAIQDFDQAIKLNPNYAIAFNNRGVAYGAKGQHDRAIQDFDEAIKLNPCERRQPSTIAASPTGPKASTTTPSRTYDQAIKLNPSYAIAFYIRSRAKAKKGDKEGADADLAAARRINPRIGR